MLCLVMILRKKRITLTSAYFNIHIMLLFSINQDLVRGLLESILLNQLLFFPCVRVDPKLESHKRWAVHSEVLCLEGLMSLIFPGHSFYCK